MSLSLSSSLTCFYLLSITTFANAAKKTNTTTKKSSMTTGNGTYNFQLTDMWQGDTFFDSFTFFTGADPTQGFVNYVNESYAQATGMIKTTSTNAYIYADSTNIVTNNIGRDSVRIQSQKTYNNGLFILSLNHMPEGCGTWPAFWSVGPNWPENGEIDIIEGVNSQTVDIVTLHTGQECDMSSVASEIEFNGQWSTCENGPCYDCYVDADDEYYDEGCGEESGSSTSFGSTFNANGGGYYVMLWDDSINNLLNIWYFDNSNVPIDIKNNDPSNDCIASDSWGEPNAQFLFGDNCDGTIINTQTIAFDLTFCGTWAGSVWSSDPVCSQLDSSCNDWVANNPSYFVNAYWDINYLAVFSL